MLQLRPSLELLAALLALGCGQLATAAAIGATPADYRDKLKLLQPGDELLLAPGTYTEGLPLHHLQGTAQQPIVIRAAGNQPARLLASARRNTVSIVDSAYLQLRDLLLDGNGQPADAVRAEGYARFAHHITLENLIIVNHGRGQAFVGISTKCPAWNWVIRGNRIVGAGTGMYLGNSDGRAPFIAGLIEHNLIAGSIGYNLQIKHQAPRPELPGMPQGVSRTLIRHNVLIKDRNSSGGADARPSMLVGHWPLQGPGQEDRYEIYGNFFYQNPAEALFQGEGNLAFYNNLLVNDQGDGVHIQPHNDVPRRIAVFHNTVLARGNGIRVHGGLVPPEQPFRIAANAVFAGQPLSGGEQEQNLTAARSEASVYLTAPDAPLGRLRLDPLPGRLLAPGTGLEWIDEFGDAERDYDGRRLGPAYRGAYAKTALEPLRPGRKPLPRNH
ncbi:MAG: hypothetical protein U1F63_11220 [Chitinivorax sp.]